MKSSGVQISVNEIIWKRTCWCYSAVHESNRFGICTDTILYFSISEKSNLNVQYNLNSNEYQEYIETRFTNIDSNGRNVISQQVWSILDIGRISYTIIKAINPHQMVG